MENTIKEQLKDLRTMRRYIRTLRMLAAKAVHDVFPSGRLYVDHAVSKGYYCKLKLARPTTAADILAVKQRMQALIAANLPIETIEKPTAEVVALFRSKEGMLDKALLLETVGDATAIYNVLDGFADSFYGNLFPTTGIIYLFDLMPYDGGFLLRVPDPDNPDELRPYIKQEQMWRTFQKEIEWEKAMGMKNVGDLNIKNRQGVMPTMVKVAEVLQERAIGEIADEIAEKHKKSGVRVVLISGPSSSGKTTFCKRLQIQLYAQVLHPLMLSLDDYFVNREQNPRDENGEYDYETIHAIDLKQFNSDLEHILAGEKVALPTYNFQTGKREYLGNTIQMQPNSVLVMEGIHAMNPQLTPALPEHVSHKIYVSALTSIALDAHNCIPTTDNRLVRRIVRDAQFRGCSAGDTLARWASVRKGEEKWIFPFQENAHSMFNSAMLYELAALRPIAEPLLQAVPNDDPQYPAAQRLLNFLHYFNPINREELPNTSLLREFVGGSSFEY
ncbi:uridine kinase [Bacteroidia bacterium]|nr:uridine kinase [Bacteroidia bacterium]